MSRRAQIEKELVTSYHGMRVIYGRDMDNNPTVSYTRGIDLSGSLEGAVGIGGLAGTIFIMAMEEEISRTWWMAARAWLRITGMIRV